MEVDRATTAAKARDSSGAMAVDTAGSVERPRFEPLMPSEMGSGRPQFRTVPVPSHRFAPLKKAWMEIYTSVYEHMKVDIRMNLKARRVKLKTRQDTPDVSNLQKCAYFVHAFMLGFDVALLRHDDLYVDSFEIKDVKTLRGENLSRAIERLSGKGGKIARPNVPLRNLPGPVLSTIQRSIYSGHLLTSRLLGTHFVAFS